MTAKIRWGTGWVDVDYNGYGEIADTSKTLGASYPNNCIRDRGIADGQKYADELQRMAETLSFDQEESK